jgi:hypothetical protein
VLRRLAEGAEARGFLDIAPDAHVSHIGISQCVYFPASP